MNEDLKDSFVNEVSKAVKELVPEAELTFKSVVKQNDVKLTGLTVKLPDSGVAPAIYLEDIMKKIDDEASQLKEIARDVAKVLVNGQKPEFDSSMILDRKDQMTLEIASLDANKEMLKSMPHRRVTDDLAVYPVIRFDMDGGKGSVKVTKELCGIMGITGREALEIAAHNMEQERCRITPMSEVLRAMAPGMPMNDTGPEMIYVVTNDDGMKGAALPFASRRSRQAIMDAVGGAYVILPSSVHEVLAVPVREMEKNGMTRDSLRDLVKTVNMTTVRDTERLSDNVYTVNERLQIAVYDGQKQEQAMEPQTMKEGMRI